MAPLNFGILLSGSGTNLQAIIDEIEAGRLNAKISLVVSSRPDAYGITRAQNSNIKTLVMDKTQYANPELADETIVEALKEAGAEYVVMAGYMRMVTPVMLNAYPNKVINLHPALLPSFKGAHGIKDAFDAGVKITGITVHFANAEYDKGPIIAQVAIPISEDDTLESLEEKIHTEEHKLYPKVLQLISESKVNVLESGKVKIG